MKPVYDAVLFDFDGTLTESHRGILASAYETLDAMGVEAPPEAVMRRMIGPPLWFTFTELCHMPPEQAEEAIERFRVKYDSWGVYQNQLYPHVEEMLEELKQAGVALCAATSKSPVAAGNVFSFFHLERWLSYLSTPDGEEKSSNKKELILKALNHLGVPPERAVMVGDTRYDALGAKEAGTAFIGVLYGYGTREEMEQAGADCFAASVPELENILLGVEKNQK